MPDGEAAPATSLKAPIRRLHKRNARQSQVRDEEGPESQRRADASRSQKGATSGNFDCDGRLPAATPPAVLFCGALPGAS
jgi:hypothetical protein